MAKYNLLTYIDSRHFYSFPSRLRTLPKFFSSRPKKREITHFPRQHFLENLFPSTAETGGGNHNLLYQNSVGKNEDDFEH